MLGPSVSGFAGEMARERRNAPLLRCRMVPEGCDSGGSGRERRHPNEVVGRDGQFGPELVACNADVAQLPSSADRLGPAEDLLHALANPLTDGVAAVPRGPLIDRTAPPARVLGNVRRYLPPAT